MAVVRFKRPTASVESATAHVPLSISRPELLSDGSDREFRRLIHRMLIGSARLAAIREAIADHIGVTGTQYTIMMSILHLQDDGGISISALADYLEVTGPHVTALVGKLAARGYVKKSVNPKDRRGVLVRLTPMGRKRLLQAFEFIRNVNDRLFSGLSRDDFRAAAGFNAKFIQNTQATLDWIDGQSDGRARARAIEL